MKKPVLTLGNEKYEMKPVKARIWRIMLQFEQDKKDIDISMFILSHCEILGELFGVDASKIEDEADLQDIVKTYMDCFAYVMGLVTKKTEELPKEKNAWKEIWN